MGRKAVLAVAAGLILASCGPASYPKELLAQRLTGVCKAEYGLDVKAQVVGTTLGAMVVIPGLIDELRRHAPSSMPELPPVLIEGRYAQQALDFRMFTRGTFERAEKKPAEEDNPRKETPLPLKKLQQVSTALMRACLSTDAPLEFYVLIARDPGPDHLDVVLAGHILDTKRVQFYAISFSELQNRNEISLRHQPEEAARATVAEFAKDLHRLPLPQLLSRYTAPSKRFGELLPMVLAVAMDWKDKEEELKPEEWPVRQIKRDAALVFVRPYLFTVQLEESAASLLSIDKLEGSSLPAAYRQFGPPERWGDSFYLEAISLSQFVTEQIAKRVMSEFKPSESELEKAEPEPKKSAAERPATVEEVMKSLMGAAAYITDNYNFKGFREVTVVDALNGTRWSVPAAQLPLYRKRDAPELKPIP